MKLVSRVRIISRSMWMVWKLRCYVAWKMCCIAWILFWWKWTQRKNATWNGNESWRMIMASEPMKPKSWLLDGQKAHSQVSETLSSAVRVPMLPEQQKCQHRWGRRFPIKYAIKFDEFRKPPGYSDGPTMQCLCLKCGLLRME